MNSELRREARRRRGLPYERLQTVTEFINTITLPTAQADSREWIDTDRMEIEEQYASGYMLGSEYTRRCAAILERMKVLGLA